VCQALGVARDADAATVKAAYRRIAAANHPDRAGHDATRFQRASQAYDAWQRRHGERPQTSTKASDIPVDEILSTFQELFGGSFGGTPKDARPARGSDLRLDLAIAPDDAEVGCRRTVAITRRLCCTSCRGVGGSNPEPCAACQGKGMLHRALGAVHIQNACPGCKGRGTRWASPCPACDDGMVAVSQTIEVVVPPGVQSGQLLRIRDKGNEHPTGPCGALLLAVEVTGAALREMRRGDDVVMEVPVDVRRFLIGGSITVDTLVGPREVRVPRWPRDQTTISLHELGHRKTAADGVYRGAITRGAHRVVLRVSAETRRAAFAIIAVVVALFALVLVGALR